MATKVNRSSEIIDQVFKNETTQAELLSQEGDRFANYEIFWDMYKGKHWDETEEESDIPTVVFNKCKTLINKMISFLVGKPFTIDYTDEQIEQLLAPFVNIILDNSGGVEIFGYEALQMGCVTGDLFIKVVFDEKTNEVYLQVKDSKDVKVRYSFVDYKNNIPDEAEISWVFLDTDDQIKTKKEVWTDEEVVILIEDEEKERKPNLLGRVPIVHIRNEIMGKEVYGISSIKDMEPLNKLLNYAIRRFINDVDYNGSPTTIVFGAKIKNLEKGENKMWGNMPEKGRVENLLIESDLPAQQKMIEYINDQLHETACIPVDSVTGNENISNTSGVALYMNNLPIMELTDRKAISYGRGFKAAIMLALELMYKIELKKKLEIKTGLLKGYLEEDITDELLYTTNKKITNHFIFSGIIENVDIIKSYYEENANPYIRLKKWNDLTVKFQSFLPKDRLALLQEISQELSLGLESKRGAMKRLGKDNIDQTLQEAEEDLKRYSELETQNIYGQPSGDVSEGMSTQPGDNE